MYAVVVNGISGGGNTAWNTASTRAIKTNFEDIDVLNGLRTIKIQKWTFTDNNNLTHDEFIGPVAEDVQEAWKLRFENDNLYPVDGIALKAAQELDTCVTDLKACICSLTDCINNRLSALEAKLQ